MSIVLEQVNPLASLAERLGEGMRQEAQLQRQQELLMSKAQTEALIPAMRMGAMSGDPSVMRQAQSALGMVPPARHGSLADRLAPPTDQVSADEEVVRYPGGVTDVVEQIRVASDPWDDNLTRLAAAGFAPAVAKQQFLIDLEKARRQADVKALSEQMTAQARGVADFQKQSLEGMHQARDRKSRIAQLRNVLPQAELGVDTWAGAAELLGYPRVAEVAKSGPTKQVLAQATELYKSMRQSESGRKLFSQEVPSELSVTVINTPEQIEGLLRALEMGTEYDIMVGELMQEAAARAQRQGRALSTQDQSDVIDAAGALIEQIYPDKREVEASLFEMAR